MADNLEPYTVTFYTAGDAAQRLGVSVNMLRRYAKALEAIEGQGVIKLDPQRGRLYTYQQVDILMQAREYVAAKPGTSVENALRAALGMEGVVVNAPSPPPTERALQAAIEAAMQGALTEAVRPLEEKIEGLEREVRALTRQLEAPRAHRVSIVPIDPYREQLEQRNRDLEAELERRRLEAEAIREPGRWWRLWRR